MTPSSTVNNMINSTATDSVFLAKLGEGDPSCGVSASDLDHVSFAQYLAPSSLCPSSLSNSVLCVVFLRSEEMMVGAHTWRIVTSVKHAKAVRDLSVMNLPRNSVRGCAGNRSISVSGRRSPNPALALRAVARSLVNLRPESFLQCATGRIVAILTTVFALVRKDMAWACIKALAAFFTRRVRWFNTGLTSGSISTQLRAEPSIPPVDFVCLREKGDVTGFASAWYRFLSQGVNLLRLGLALVRLGRVHQHPFGLFAF